MHHKMDNLESITNENNTKHNEKLSYNHPYRILIIGGSGSGKNKHIAEYNKGTR